MHLIERSGPSLAMMTLSALVMILKASLAQAIADAVRADTDPLADFANPFSEQRAGRMGE